MPHLLVAGKLHEAGEALLRDLPSRGFSVDYVEELSESSYAPLIGRADALVIRTQPLTAATIAQAERLRVVSRHGVGYDSVDVTALTSRGIALTIAGDVNSVSVAEHAMMQMLAAAKRALAADDAVRDPARWGWRNQLQAREISNRNLLLVGYGRAGRRVAQMARGFDMDIRAHDPLLEARGWPEGPVAPVSLADGLRWADFISVHVPRGDRPLIGSEEIALMKPGVVIVNTSRGGVVDEAALALALASGQVGAAGVDVFEEEPPIASPLMARRDAILSPHIAGLTNEASERLALASIRNAVDFLEGSIDRHLVVNPEILNG